ncbi:hypothetical protein MHK_010464 [Candidatus Magnetomorum sp. HK-1]|nr:hypothetical protein MHK_010464 [Candidatus Magnetomorum sp. HK-1]
MKYTTLHNNIFHWDGFGGKLKLASGSCLLRVVHLTEDKGIPVARPFIIITEDIPAADPAKKNRKLSMRSCIAHIATRVTQKFSIDPRRMLWLEYYPESIYGMKQEKCIPEQYEVVSFTWEANKAFHPQFRTLKSPVRDQVKIIHQQLQKGDPPSWV